MTDCDRNFGADVRMAREAARLTQRDLALMLGVSEMRVSKIETSRQPLSDAMEKSICEVLKIYSPSLGRERAERRAAKALARSLIDARTDDPVLWDDLIEKYLPNARACISAWQNSFK